MTTEQKIFLGQCFNNATHIVAASLKPTIGGLNTDELTAKRVKALTIALGAEMKDLFLEEEDKPQTNDLQE